MKELTKLMYEAKKCYSLTQLKRYLDDAYFEKYGSYIKIGNLFNKAYGLDLSYEEMVSLGRAIRAGKYKREFEHV